MVGDQFLFVFNFVSDAHYGGWPIANMTNVKVYRNETNASIAQFVHNHCIFPKLTNHKKHHTNKIVLLSIHKILF